MSNLDFREVMRILELPMLKVHCQSDLEDLKKVIRAQRKALAKKYHPDKVKGEEERMKIINNLCDILLKAKLQIRQPIRYYYYQTATSYSGTSSTTSGGW